MNPFNKFEQLGLVAEKFGESVQRLFKKQEAEEPAEQPKCPIDIESYLAQKKQREPFYKSAHKTKPWE